MRKIDVVVLHHSASENATVEAIRRYHMHRRGMSDIFYHYLIDRTGVLHTGRSEEQPSTRRRPTAIEVCVLGSLHKTPINLLQHETLLDLLDSIYSSFGHIPVKGHNDFSNTICPASLDVDFYHRYLQIERRKDSMTWKKEIIELAEKRGIIMTGVHEAEEVAEKWFVLAVLMNALDKKGGNGNV